MFMNSRSIPCRCDPSSFVLTPMDNFNQTHDGVNAFVDIQNDPIGGCTGTLSFAGGVKAFLTFGDDGSLIGYTLTDNNVSTQTSVENILATI